MARRERNIYKRRDGRFEGRFIKEGGGSGEGGKAGEPDGSGKAGKARYGSVYAKTYAEVKRKLDAAKALQAQMARTAPDAPFVLGKPVAAKAPIAAAAPGLTGVAAELAPPASPVTMGSAQEQEAPMAPAGKPGARKAARGQAPQAPQPAQKPARHSQSQQAQSAPAMQAQAGRRFSKSKTVGAILRKYLESLRGSAKPSTYRIYAGHLKNHILPCLGKVRCAQLTQARLQDFFDAKAESGLAAATARSILALLKAGLRDCPVNGKLDVRLQRPASRKAEVLSRDEQRLLEAGAKKSGPQSYVAVMLCLYTGIRIGELCGLTWEDVDFSEKALFVRRTLQRIPAGSGGAFQSAAAGDAEIPACGAGGGGGKPARKGRTQIALLPPKSPSSERRIPLPDLLLAILARHRGESEGRYVLSKGGAFMEPRTLQYRFQSLLKASGVRHVNFHATRHTFATRALETGFDIKTLSEILGHASATVTLNRYAHSLDAHKRSSMESLAAIFAKS